MIRGTNDYARVLPGKLSGNRVGFVDLCYMARRQEYRVSRLGQVHAQKAQSAI